MEVFVMLEKGDSVGITACSNALSKTYEETIKELDYSLYDVGLTMADCSYIYGEKTAVEKANQLNELFANPDIKAIFDVSGGDAANELLPYLDYDVIKDSGKVFHGYSDLTTIINAIYAKTDKVGCLYDVRNLIFEYRERQMADFVMTIMSDEDDLWNIDCEFVQGEKMKGIVVGGNARCFLKLAGTEYMPSLKHKILLLESRSGNAVKVRSYFTQLAQMGAFKEVEGVLLGTFLEMEKEGIISAADMLKEICGNKNLPIATTNEVGHRSDSKAVYIGREIELPMR